MPITFPKQLLRAYLFHRKWSASIVGHHAASGLALARAELAVDELGWYFIWRADEDADWSWMSKAERAREHDVSWCELVDAEGEHLASLSGIFDCTWEYRRTVEAELASEADAVQALADLRASLETEVIPGMTGAMLA